MAKEPKYKGTKKQKKHKNNEVFPIKGDRYYISLIFSYHAPFDYSAWKKTYTICYFFLISLIPQHYCKLNLLRAWSTKSCPGLCYVRILTYLSVAIRKQAKLWYDMAKLQIKSEKLTLLGGKKSGHGAIWHHIVFCNRLNPREDVYTQEGRCRKSLIKVYG